jgi:hypothetical protein
MSGVNAPVYFALLGGVGGERTGGVLGFEGERVK